ncbi:MAG TPA: hypothetical protein VGD40_02455 [Chryseosolibacter sp.]
MALPLYDVLRQLQSRHVRRLMDGCRNLIFCIYPDAIETMTGKSRVIGYFTSPAKQDCICWMMVAQNHLTIGFPHGNEITDATGILRRFGKRGYLFYRIVRLRDIYNNPALFAILEQAVIHLQRKVQVSSPVAPELEQK